MFLIILGCHIPFLFFSGKEALLGIVDELYRHKTSNLLKRFLNPDGSVNLVREDEDTADIPASLYYPTSILLYALEIYLSIQIDSISTVFGFIGTIAGTSLSFFIPSVLFYKAYN